MNKNKPRIIAFVLVALIGIVYFATRKHVVPLTVVPDNTKPSVIEKKEVCYYKETVGTQSTDNAFTSINYDEGGKVHGIINWIPGEKDSLVGSYIGTIENNNKYGGATRLNIIYTASGEGIVNKQQEIIVVDDVANQIKTGIGEKVQDKDGIWRFKDVKTLIYDNPLPMVDCNTVPERFKKDYSIK